MKRSNITRGALLIQVLIRGFVGFKVSKETYDLRFPGLQFQMSRVYGFRFQGFTG